MIQSFADKGTRHIYEGQDTRWARSTCPSLLWPAARDKLDRLHEALTLDDLRLPPGNRLERLKGDRLGVYSIRVNDQYRLCFQWTQFGPADELVDYH